MHLFFPTRLAANVDALHPFPFEYSLLPSLRSISVSFSLSVFLPLSMPVPVCLSLSLLLTIQFAPPLLCLVIAEVEEKILHWPYIYLCMCISTDNDRTILSVGAVGAEPIGTRPVRWSVHCPLWGRTARRVLSPSTFSPLPSNRAGNVGEINIRSIVVNNISPAFSRERAAIYRRPRVQQPLSSRCTGSAGFCGNACRANINYYSLFSFFFTFRQNVNQRQIIDKCKFSRANLMLSV